MPVRPFLLWPLAFAFLSACGAVTFHPADRVDEDGDSYFAPGDPAELVGRTVGDLDALRLDCDDGDDNSFPGAAELCDGQDNDCDGTRSAAEVDSDGDGFSPCGWDVLAERLTDSLDCNDDLNGWGVLQAPLRVEVCGAPRPDGVLRTGYDADRLAAGLDDDCDGSLSEGEVDEDQDGHMAGCTAVDIQNPSEPELAADCNDEDPDIRPSVPLADAVCISDADGYAATNCAVEAPPGSRIEWVPDLDQDGDGSRDVALVRERCAGEAPSDDLTENWVRLDDITQTDCDDQNPQLHGLDLDFDGQSPCDGDRFPSGLSADSDPDIFDGALELCDAKDNDVDGMVDDGFDLDGDGSFRSEADPPSCIAAYGAQDCDDNTPLLNSNDVDGDGQTTCGDDATLGNGDEDCDDGNALISGGDADGDTYSPCGADPDCDDTDAAITPADDDGDGYDECATGFEIGDCDDGNALRSPDREVQCDGVFDSNCDLLPEPLEVDDDGDLYVECASTDGLDPALLGGNDCNDNNVGLNPADGDGDGFSTCSGDCDDAEVVRFPGAPGACDTIDDNDCNGVVDTNEADQDGDGQSPCDDDCDDLDPAVEALDADGDGTTTCAGDCNDTDIAFPADVDGDQWSNCAQGAQPADCDDNDADLGWDDADGDGATACSASPDCDDNDADLNPHDDDGDLSSPCDGDCDDDDSVVRPGAAETRDGVDEDCDGIADEGTFSGGELVVVELMIGADPATGDARGEYVELWNSSSEPIDLRGLVVESTDAVAGLTTTFAFPSDADPDSALIVPVDGRFVVARDGTALVYGVEIADATWSAALFADGGGSITLVHDGFDLDTVQWSATGCTANCASTTPTYGGPGYWRTGHAMALRLADLDSNAAAANDDPSRWCEESMALGARDFGSPGLASGAQIYCGI